MRRAVLRPSGARSLVTAAAFALGALLLSACGSTESVVAASTSPAEPAGTESAATASMQATTTLGETIDLVPANEETLLWFWAPW